MEAVNSVNRPELGEVDVAAVKRECASVDLDGEMTIKKMNGKQQPNG